MANKKAGFDFFNMDTARYLDLKVKRLKKAHGATGIAVYDYLLSSIYRENGYFIQWSEHLCFDVADYFDLSEDQVLGIVNTCNEVGLFNEPLFHYSSILTSKGIQERYLEMCKACRRTGAEIEEGYKADVQNVGRMGQNAVIIDQNVGRMSAKEPDQPDSSSILPQTIERIDSIERKRERVEGSGLSPDPHPQNAEEFIFKSSDLEPQPTSQPEQKKQTGPGRKKQVGKPTSLEDSQWGDRAAFDAALPDWDQAKLDHYWDALKNYSNKGNVFKDWIQTAQNWERKDREKAGKNGHAKPESPTQTDDITRIIDEFNALTQSDYNAADEAIRGYLAARLMDGCQLQDMLDVITLKAVQWGSGDSRKYLKFHILFKPEKYPGYVQEVKDAKSGKIKVLNPNESRYDRIQRKIDAALGRTQPS